MASRHHTSSISTIDTDLNTADDIQIRDAELRQRHVSKVEDTSAHGSTETLNSFEDLDDSEFHKPTYRIGTFILDVRNFFVHPKFIRIFVIILLLAFIALCCYSLYYDFYKALPILVGLCVFVLALAFHWIPRALTPAARYSLAVKFTQLHDKWKKYKWIPLLIFLAAILVFVVVDAVMDDVSRLQSLLGIFFIGIAFVISKSYVTVDWVMMLAAVILQFALGLVSLRWDTGLNVLEWISDMLAVLVGHTNAGIVAAFGAYQNTTDDNYVAFTADHRHELAFQALPPIIFFGALTSLLYYIGVIQILIRYFGYIMYFFMGVGPAEAFVAAANVFLGPNTSVLTVKGFLEGMTMSELHCIMTSGFATVAGSLFGLYLSFGIPPSHLIAASVMSAPAALAFSKIIFPETKKSLYKDPKKIKFHVDKYGGLVDAYVSGAYEGLNISINVAAALIGFVAFLQFFDSTIIWMGDRMGVEVSFAIITSYLFWPLPYLMGVPAEDCHEVARVIGTKIFLTDIVGYIELSTLMENRRQNLTPFISERSEVLTVYALCGFASFPDIAICLSAISAIVPKRRSDLSRVAVRAMVAGNLACFFTASVAGLLYRA